jgi:hypothetical protein
MQSSTSAYGVLWLVGYFQNKGFTLVLQTIGEHSFHSIIYWHSGQLVPGSV